MWGISCLPENQVASKEGLCSKEQESKSEQLMIFATVIGL